MIRKRISRNDYKIVMIYEILYQKKIKLKHVFKKSSLIDFKGMSTLLLLFHAKRLENQVRYTFIFTFFGIVLS